MFCAISAKRVGYAELFADAYRRRILDFAVSWNRTRALSGGIEIDAVAAARIKRQPFFLCAELGLFASTRLTMP